MTRLWIALALVSVCFASAQARQPYELIRDLQRIQDRVAAGDAAATDEQARVLAALAEAFSPRTLTGIDDPRNARAAVLFALSGGDPAAIGNLDDVIEPAVLDPALVKAARSYASGRLEAARQSFDAVQTEDLPPGLLGQVALSRAIVASDDPERARRLLDEARLLMPGTLVEEVALRRSAMAAASAGDRAAFESQTRRYFERFSGSVYAQAFSAQVVEAVVGLKYGGGPGWLTALDDMIGSVPPAGTSGLWLQIARLALPKGDLVLARHASLRTIELAPQGSAEALGARAHLAAVRLVTGDYESALADLQALQRTGLTGSDRQVLDQALDLAASIRWSPMISGAGPGRAPASAAAPAAEAEQREAVRDPVDDLIERTEAALALPDETLEAAP